MSDIDSVDKYKMDLVHILVWTTYTFPVYYISSDKTFREYGCEPDNCVLTNAEEIIDNDFSKFNAVIFDVFYLYHSDCDRLPERHPYQKYIALSTEPFYKYRLNDSRYDAFFNWTATYRLDSDIPYPFIAIKDRKDNIVGPKIEMHWETDVKYDKEDRINHWHNKTKAAAWFASWCKTPSNRIRYVQDLNIALSRYSLGVDSYGSCGKFVCPKNGPLIAENILECDRMMGKNYFFYLAFENEFSEDYVTEKVLRALNNDVVPVVYGGANYSRFLPSNTYLDARRHTPEELAFIMKELMEHPNMYRRFFWWKSHYSFHDPMKNLNICSICTALNNKTKFETTSVYHDIRTWLNR